MKIEAKLLADAAAAVYSRVPVGRVERVSVALTFACDIDRDTAAAALSAAAVTYRRVEAKAKMSLRRAAASDRSAWAMTATDAQNKAEALEALRAAIKEAR